MEKQRVAGPDMAPLSIAIDREWSFLACMAEGEMLLDAERDAEGGRTDAIGRCKRKERMHGVSGVRRQTEGYCCFESLLLLDSLSSFSCSSSVAYTTYTRAYPYTTGAMQADLESQRGRQGVVSHALSEKAKSKADISGVYRSWWRRQPHAVAQPRTRA
jgi:hypothetical protein